MVGCTGIKVRNVVRHMDPVITTTLTLGGQTTPCSHLLYVITPVEGPGLKIWTANAMGGARDDLVYMIFQFHVNFRFFEG